MSDDKDLDRARDHATAARERLLGDAHAVQARLKPAAIAINAWDGIRTKSETLADNAAGLARRRPIAVGAAALGAVAIFARKPILRLFKRATRDNAKPATPASRRPRRTTGDDR